MVDRKGPVLIIPVENQVRELDAKLLLAAVAAERGFRVIIGSRFYLHFALPFLPRGVVIAKSLRSVSRATLEFTAGLGHEVVAWDEEGLVRFDSPEYFAWRYSERAFATAARLFTWGVDDAEFFKRYPGYTGVPIHVTGNPRADLLTPSVRGIYESDAAEIRRRYGDYILINTNFSFVNNFVRDLNLVHKRPGGGVSVSRSGRGLSAAFASGMADHQAAIQSAFRELIPALARAFPERAIVLRPHPSENHVLWRAMLHSEVNAHVLHEGNAIPWLMAARALVHNGCTTAVEAAVLGTPSVAYRPVTSPVYDYALPNSLSHEVFDPDQAVRRVGEIVIGQLGPIDTRQRDAILARHLAQNDDSLASDRVVDALIEAGYRDRALVRPRLDRYARGWLGMNARTLVQRLNMLRPGSRHSASHQAHRFPSIPSATLNRRLQQFAAQLRRFGDVRVDTLARDIFVVERAG